MTHPHTLSESNVSLLEQLRDAVLPEREHLSKEEKALRKQFRKSMRVLRNELKENLPFHVTYKRVQEELWLIRLLILKMMSKEEKSLSDILETSLTLFLEYPEPLARELCKHLHRTVLVTIAFAKLFEEKSGDRLASTATSIPKIPLHEYFALIQASVPFAKDLIENVHSSLALDMCVFALFILFEERKIRISEVRMQELVRYAHLQSAEYERLMRKIFGVRLPSTEAEQQEWRGFVRRTSGMFSDVDLQRPEQRLWTKREEMW